MPRRTYLPSVLLMSAMGIGHAAVLPKFPPGAVWNQDISAAPLRSDSASLIATLDGICGGQSSGCGFGFGRMQIDFSIMVLNAPVGAPTATMVQHVAYEDYYAPDCEPLGSTMPIPIDGAIEGNPGYSCDNTSEDCHLLVVQGNTLYEAYSANLLAGNQLEALCLAKWRLDRVYPPEGRGEHCTSADAAGFPIAALLFNADEIRAAMAQPAVADRVISHAIRFILPNDRMASLPDGPDQGTERDPEYVRPASHAGGPVGPLGSVPYGARLRLRANFPFTGYNPAAQVILRTMQRYGIVLADGGSVALTAESDRFTTAKWADADIGLDPNDGGSRVFDQTPGTTPVDISDFAIIDTGPAIPETYDCIRTPEILALLFQSSFE
jgi:hypothetical protein